MGLHIGTLTKILLGFGLGIIVVSCLTVVIVFGKFANGFSKYDKIKMKFSFNYQSEVYSTSLAITVLGCFAFVSALAAIVLTFIMEDKTIILIIVGAVSAVFTFGCIIAEGLFTKYDQQLLAKDNYMFYYHISDPNGGYKYGYLTDEYNHKNAQKHIKESIEELYTVAYSHFKEAEKDGSMKFAKTIPEWSDFKKKLGTVDSNKEVITYSNIWKGSDSNFITLNINSPYIYATFDSKEVYVAYTTFTKNTTYTPKKQLCVYNSDRTDFTCQISDLVEDYIGEYNILNDYNIKLTEKIIVDNYVSKSKENKDGISVNYLVSEFPFAFKKLTYKDNKLRKEKYDQVFYFENDDKHFKVSAKEYVESKIKDDIKSKKDSVKNQYTMVPKFPKNFSNYENEVCDKDDYTKDDKDNYYICDKNSHSYPDIIATMLDNIDDFRKGNVPSKIKKHIKSENNKLINDYLTSDYLLYHFALINLIVQIVGLVLWACGKFLSKNDSDDKSPSENEA